MSNPWEEIPLTDYESHMKLESVGRLQAMNKMMKGQLYAYPVSSVMIFGIAGGNGLEHIEKDKFEKIYALDVNAAYLDEVKHRYSCLGGLLECLHINLTDDAYTLPKTDMVIANLLVEYIGCKCFQKAVARAKAQYVSCIIQINTQENWVSDSPYLHTFDCLEQVHCQMDEHTLQQTMAEIGYRIIKKSEYPLPNGKKFVQLDFKK